MTRKLNKPLRRAARQQFAHDVATRYRQGTSVSDLATAIGRRPSLIRRLLEEQGVEFEPHAELVRRYEGGASLDTLSQEQGISRRALREMLVHRGVTIRRSGQDSEALTESTDRP